MKADAPLPAGLLIIVCDGAFRELRLWSKIHKQTAGTADGVTTGTVEVGSWSNVVTFHGIRFRTRTHYLASHRFKIIDCDENKALLVEHALGGTVNT